MASQCIRCGSKEHTTREHDEQKVKAPQKAKAPGAAKRPASPQGGDGLKRRNAALHKITKVAHPTCFSVPSKLTGIPEIIDKPLRDRFYQDPEPQSWMHRALCECQQCEKKRNKRRIDMQRRFHK